MSTRPQRVPPHAGDRIDVRGGKLAIAAARGFCLYALQAAIPLPPAKLGPTQPADWMGDGHPRRAPIRRAG